MTRSQQEAQRELDRAQAKWLKAYGWEPRIGGELAAPMRWSHHFAPKAKESYTTRDALELTRAEPLRYGGPR